jgi:AcrR family transcriptional regulator
MAKAVDPEQILLATREVLATSGSRRLSLSDVAKAAGVSRPTLYKWFPTKDALLEEFSQYEQRKYDAGLAAAVQGLAGDARLDAILRFVVEFQQTYSLRDLVDVEPEHVLRQMARALPVLRRRLVPMFEGAEAEAVAAIVVRIALSHALLPDDDPDELLRELRVAAGIAHLAQPATRRRLRAAR